MPAAHDAPDLAALPPELRAAFEAERAARLHLEAEMADQKAYAARLEALLREMRRARFGPRSEKLHPDQLALALEDIETAIAEAKTGHENRPAAKAGDEAPERPKPQRALPVDLPRIERVIEPDSIACTCGCGEMLRIGEDRVVPEAPSPSDRPGSPALGPCHVVSVFLLWARTSRIMLASTGQARFGL